MSKTKFWNVHLYLWINQWFQYHRRELLKHKSVSMSNCTVVSKHKGNTLNSGSGILKGSAGGRSWQTFATRRLPYQLRPQIWCVIRDRHTTSQQFSSEGGEVHTLMVHISIQLSCLQCGLYLFWWKIPHLANKFCKKGICYPPKLPISSTTQFLFSFV